MSVQLFLAISNDDVTRVQSIIDAGTDISTWRYSGQSVNLGQVLNPYLFMTDLDYLDDFLGGATSIDYSIAPEVV